MPAYDLAYLVTLVTVTFCALMFSVLVLFYWRERQSHQGSVFAAFSITCAGAFVVGLLLRILPAWETPLTICLDTVTGIVPALLFHLVSQGRVPKLRFAFYTVCGAAAIAAAFDDAELASIPFVEQLPPIMLSAAGVLGLAFVSVANRRQRAWYRGLLILTIVAALASLFYRSPVTMLAPDYLLLGFFCVTLYYQERIIFFDLLIKRGAYFFAGLLVVALIFLFRRAPDPLIAALILMPLLLLAPWANASLGRVIDRFFLRRRYSHTEAERFFISELQSASTEDNLRSRTERCLAEIFQSRARAAFVPDAAGECTDIDALYTDLGGCGHVIVEPRHSGIPFMSDDRRLFQSLTNTLAVVLENVRFREREDQLRLLASRAELRALRAQINPHFLFNALNAIAGLIPSQPDLADHTIEKLADVFRYTLRSSQREWVRLDEEAEFVAAYLQVEQARFGERLHVEIAIDPDAKAVLVPAMCIQPLVENALKHGVAAVAERGIVRLSITACCDSVNIEVYDNGPGFPQDFSLDDSAGHALRNIAERLQGYYGSPAALSWGTAGTLTRVALRIPHD